MRERPILFSGPMVRAILDGTKTQTRRVVKWRHPSPGLNHSFTGLSVYSYTPTTFTLESQGERRSEPTQCPYGQVGDRLWVREATLRVEEHGYAGPVYVESDMGRACLEGGLAPSPDDFVEVEPYDLRIRPSIHMPKRVARIWLEITNVHVERLHAISEQDCITEGATGGHGVIPKYAYNATPIEHFRHIWKSTGGDWDANPFVWVVEFKRIPAPTTDTD